MIVDKAGEIIVDILTLSPSLANIPSASALLDTSNFTFQAISYGKDASGFNRHAHEYDGDSAYFVTLSYEPQSVSSYHSSAIASAVANYNLLPEYPHPHNTRLEQKSCMTVKGGISGLDVGHCANHYLHPTLSASYWKLGCFPPSGGIDYYVVKNLNNLNSFVFSGTLSGSYNAFRVMDANGFLTFAPLNGRLGASAATLGLFTSGVLITPQSDFSSTGKIPVTWRLDAGDAGSLLLFGGIYHLGLWCLDIKAMLEEGHKPPFSFDALNNIRKYRLFAKKTFNKDLLYINDSLGYGGFNVLFDNGNPPYDAGWDKYILYQWTIRFL